MPDRVLQNFLAAVKHQQPDQIPVMVYNTAPWSTSYVGVRADEYYFAPELRFRTQMFFTEEFPSAWLLPGIWPEFTVLEPSMFDCPITWYPDSGPHAHPIMDHIRDVDKLKSVNPLDSPLVQEVIKQHHYYQEHLDRRLIEERWYLRGCPLVIGPFELAAQVRGYSEIMLDVMDYPEQVHKLLMLTTDAAIKSLKLQDELCGGLKVALVADHNTTNLSRRQCGEFLFPYIRKIVDAMPDTLIVYHNEGPANHTLEQIADCGASIFHCGEIDLARAKQMIGNRMTLMGNLHAWDLMVNGSPDDITAAAHACLEVAAYDGGYILTTGGGHDPVTPKANIRAMVDSVKEWRR